MNNYSRVWRFFAAVTLILVAAFGYSFFESDSPPIQGLTVDPIDFDMGEVPVGLPDKEDRPAEESGSLEREISYSVTNHGTRPAAIVGTGEE